MAQKLVWPCGSPVGEGLRCNEGAKERLSREERARGRRKRTGKRGVRSIDPDPCRPYSWEVGGALVGGSGGHPVNLCTLDVKLEAL